MPFRSRWPVPSRYRSDVSAAECSSCGRAGRGWRPVRRPPTSRLGSLRRVGRPSRSSGWNTPSLRCAPGAPQPREDCSPGRPRAGRVPGFLRRPLDARGPSGRARSRRATRLAGFPLRPPTWLFSPQQQVVFSALIRMELFGRTVSFILRVTVTDQGHRGTCQEVGGEMTRADGDAAETAGLRSGVS